MNEYPSFDELDLILPDTYKKELLERFIRYVKIWTTSDRHAEKTPSTENQWELLYLLEQELQKHDVTDIYFDKHGYIIARIPAGSPDLSSVPVIGFMAHIDTSSDVPGQGVKPQIHQYYDGGTIFLHDNLFLSPEEFPELSEYIGETIITTDGTTLLGSDDKAGVAEIMTAISYIRDHPGLEHGPLEIIFTPDEETGKGMDRFPYHQLNAYCCYTVDGVGDGTVEWECFNGYKADISFTGKVIHLGKARGKLVNAVSMAGAYLSLLPRNESPEATDGYYGYYCPLEISGNLEKAWIEIYLRDFEHMEIERRIEGLNTIAKAVEAAFYGGKVEVKTKKQYLNMKESYTDKPEVLSNLYEAIKRSGIEPKSTPIRGGTDGARLSENGIPTPNIFTGGFNMHSVYEWASLSAMQRATLTIINLMMPWVKNSKKSDN